MTAKMTSREIISRCIEEFEARTQVELVLNIHKSSHTYWGHFWFIVLVSNTLLWMVSAFWNTHLDFLVLIIEGVVLAGILYWLLIQWEMIQFFISKKEKQRRVLSEAHREFSELGIYKTKDRSGLLILYSHLEDECVFLMDTGVASRFKAEELETFKKDFSLAFKSKDVPNDLGSLIRSFGVYWHQVWPAEDNNNELDNSIKGLS